MRFKRILVITLIFCFSASSVFAGDPTLDRLIDNMTTGRFADKQKARQQLYYLCRYGHEDLLFPYMNGKSFLNQLAALDVAVTLKATKKLTDAVAEKLKSESPIVQRRAATTLGIYGTKESSEYLLAALKAAPSKGEKKVPATIITILNGLAVARNDVGGEAIAAHLAAAEDNEKIRFSAAYALFECKIEGQESVAKEALAKEKDPFIKSLLLGYLLVKKDAAGDELASYIENDDLNVRTIVIQAYSRIKNNALVEACKKAMSHKNEYIRLSAMKGFESVGEPKDITQILIYLDDKDNKVRQAVALALRRISKRTFGFNGYDPELKRAKAAKRWRQWWTDNAYSYDVKLN